MLHTTRITRSTLVGLGCATFAVVTAFAPASAQSVRGVAEQEKSADSLYAAKVYERALVLYDSLARRDTTVAKYWYQLGLAAAQVGRYDAGLAAFMRAARIAPNPGAAYNVGAMHARLAHTDSAFAWLTQAVKLGFSNGPLMQQDEDLASLRSDPRFAALVHSASTAPTPCEERLENRRFDFWIGEWEVSNARGARTGRSSIQRVSGGCALLENWTGNRGDTGKSLSSYNPATKQWQQFYVGQGGAVLEYDFGGWDGSSMVFRTAAAPSSPGGTTLRLSFTPLPDGRVRQHSEQSTDGGRTWTTQYDFYYTRRYQEGGTRRP